MIYFFVLFKFHISCIITKYVIISVRLQGERGLEGQRGPRGQPGIGIKGDKVEVINKRVGANILM